MFTANDDYAKTIKNVFILKDINFKKVKNGEPLRQIYRKFNIIC